MAASAFNMDDPAAPITARRGRVISHIACAWRGAGLTVVAQSRELDVEDGTLVLAQAAHADGIAIAEVAVQARLRPVVFVKYDDGRAGGRGAAQGLGLGRVAAQGVLALLGRRGGAALEAEADTSRVAVHDGDAVARGRDAEAALLDKGLGAVVEAAEDLARLRLELILLALDVGHDVVDDIHGRDARVAGARDGLHGDDADCGNGAKGSLQGGKGDDEADDGAVGVADEEAAREPVDGALVGDEVEMRKVHGRDDEGNQRVAAVVLCVGEDGDLGPQKLLLCSEGGLQSLILLPGGLPKGGTTDQHHRPRPSRGR